MGLFFSSDGSREELVAIPINLPMGWNNSPPIFCTVTETVSDLDNAALLCNQPSCKHKLDDCAKSVVMTNSLPLRISLAVLSRDP